MASSALISAAKLAARVQRTAFDSERADLCDAAVLDLGLAGVEVPETLDKLVEKAVITYTVMHFRQGDNYERLKASYDEQKAQLSMATGYTTWS